MLRRPPRSTRTDTLFPTRRSSDLLSFGISPWLGMLAGAASGAALGAVLGFVIFRRKLTGIFFALVTLAVAEMAYFIVSNTDALGAANGLSILPATGLAMFQFNDKRHYFYVALGLLTITILVTILIRRSRLEIGRAP